MEKVRAPQRIFIVSGLVWFSLANDNLFFVFQTEIMNDEDEEDANAESPAPPPPPPTPSSGDAAHASSPAAPPTESPSKQVS